ncbi:C-C motif chemokine 8 [Symphorus nematophorus]
MQFNTLFFLLVISCVSLAFAQVTYDDCCLKYVKKMTLTTRKHAVEYRRQVTDGGCNIPAIIFRMRRGREFCTDPRERWVLELMDRIDAKKIRLRHPNKRHPRRPHKG